MESIRVSIRKDALKHPRRKMKMLDAILEALQDYMIDSEIEFLQGNSNSMLISIDGQQVLIQVR